ncbi:MAG TPA: polysaccharide biosynthesis C-terminal domain-containing protein, partial [Solirubrobacteraceae bacterium]|nr:polysaccharide biosynthesis C-terminal domain-containing protein [Solirubrobacteraceae bacterium]
IGLIASTGIGLARRTRSLIWLTLIAAAVNIALNFLVIPPWGMLGAAFATAVAYTLLFGLYYMQSQRVYYTRFDLARLIRLGVLTAAAAAVGAIPIEPLTLALAIKIGVVLLFLVSLRVTGVVRPEEIGALRSVVRQRLRPTS